VFVDFYDKFRYGTAVELMDIVKGAGATTTAIKMKDVNAPAPGAPGAPGAPPPTPPQ
jgi:hypothetical protein